LLDPVVTIRIFLRTVQKHGYKKTDLEASKTLPEGSISMWENDQSAQHACFYLGDGLVFNKDAQTWFAPRQILKLESVITSDIKLQPLKCIEQLLY
jgi:hypothetical protein